MPLEEAVRGGCREVVQYLVEDYHIDTSQLDEVWPYSFSSYWLTHHYSYRPCCITQLHYDIMF